jgi:pyridinium-3,5-biscarboxylic acid mononucleotide sulfurtransferase
MCDKRDGLRHLIRQIQSAVVAYSGGVDSTLLLKIARDELGDAAIAVTADSPSLPRHELREVQAIAASIGARHVCLKTDELSDADYVANSPERCYFCKSHVGDALIAYARANGYRFVIDGNNADDAGDHRPGRRAAQERGIRSPLQESGLTKAEIRAWARELGLPNWDKPAAACLSSRIPYGTPVSTEALAQIERAESFLREQGFRQLRVRRHGPIARLELEVADWMRALEMREAIVAALREIGFAYITLDLNGFRSGSMNEVLGNG